MPTPTTAQGIPMLDAQGNAVSVPSENVQSALTQGGYKLAVNMTGPNGVKYHVPVENQDAAQKQSGYTWDDDADNAALKSYMSAVPSQIDHSTPEGFWQSAYQSSGLQNLIDLGKQKFQDAQAGRSAEQQMIKTVTDNLKAGDYASATETLLKQLVGGGTPALPILSSIANSSIQHGTSAYNAAKSGDSSTAGAEAINAIPVAGPIIAGVGDALGKMQDQHDAGNNAGAAGTATGLAGQVITAALGGDAADAGEGVADAAAPTPSTSSAVSALSGEPSESSMASYLQNNAAPAVNPKDVAAGAAARDAGLSEGAPETEAPSPAPVQASLQSGIRNALNKVAGDEGLKPIADDVSVRDAAQNLADQFKGRSQTAFDNIEKVTNVNVTALRNRIASLDSQIDDVAITDPAKAAVLQDSKLSYEAEAQRAFDDAKSKGLDVDTARSDWNKNLRSNELSQKIRAADDGKIGQPYINPDKLTRPLQKMTDSVGGRPGPLNQLLGDDTANALVSHTENAREALQEIKTFTPKSATGQKAFTKIIANNTASTPAKLGAITGQTSTKIDWGGVVRDLGNLKPAEQEGFGAELGAARQYAARKASMQAARTFLGKGVTRVGLPLAGGAAGYELTH